MGARIGSFLATLMLSVPLAAVGLMAVFGVPQLSPVNASPDADGVVRTPGRFSWPGLLNNFQQPATAAVDRSDAPAFSGQETDFESVLNDPRSDWRNDSQLGRQEPFPQNGHPSHHDHAHHDPRSDPRQTAGSMAPATSSRDHWYEDASRQSSNPAPGGSLSPDHRLASNPDRFSDSSSLVPVTDRPAPLLEPQQPGLSWRQAALKLSEMGVDNYHLEKGTTAESFLFVCSYSPGDAPHVTHRFEAEAGEPLAAVNEVLQQMESWMQQRFAAENYPSRARSLSPSSETLLR